MTGADDPTRKLAERLLDAQVAFVLAELSGDRLLEVAERDTRDALRIAENVTLADVLDPAEVSATVRTVMDLVGGSVLPGNFARALASGLYGLEASEQYCLGDVIDRDQVDALVATVLSMHTLHERALSRLTDSPLMATVATTFVNKIVGDIVAQNRAVADKIPGMGSMFALGMDAVSRVKNVSDQLLGDVAGKGAQFALKRLNSATLDLIRDAPLADAAMELWDVQAQERISELRDFVSEAELTELVDLVVELAVVGRDSEFVDAVVDRVVEVVFEQYGQRPLTEVLVEAGISEDDLVAQVLRHAPGIVAGAKADGRLADLVRARLEPFYASDIALEILAGTDA